jgi:uncharacterized membrane protein
MSKVHRMLTSAFVLVTLTLASAVSASASSVDQVTTQAREVRAEARAIKALLQMKQPDFSVIRQRLDGLDAQGKALGETLAALDADGSSLTPAQRAAVQQSKLAVDAMKVILANKSTLLADEAQALKNRSLLRAKAEAVAKRAEMVDRNFSKARG